MPDVDGPVGSGLHARYPDNPYPTNIRAIVPVSISEGGGISGSVPDPKTTCGKSDPRLSKSVFVKIERKIPDPFFAPARHNVRLSLSPALCLAEP